MPILVDGDNLLGTWGRSRSAAERSRLAAELQRFGRNAGKRIVTVFDGPPPGSGAGAARYAGHGRSADELLLEILAGQRDRRGWLVVTSDRSLGDRCRWLEARVERCDRFRRRLLDAHTTGAAGKPDTEPDVDYWLKQFGDE